jgi:fructose-bisphosphate aldolase class I
MPWDELYDTARTIVANDRGILAADESTGTIKKRFDAIGVESTEESRRAYRNLLFTTAGMEEFIGGVILYDETIRQRSDEGTPFAELLAAKGVVPGIKVDLGAKPLALYPGETVTEGLDGLRERLAEYYELGARFAKWRAVITIGDGIPTDACIDANAHALARYAALCQEAGIVPIVEPEVLMDADNTIETCDDVTGRTLRALYAALYSFDIHLRGTLLKPNMVIAGKGSAVQTTTEQIATTTVHNLKRHVPALVPGIVFLSGGQSEVQATANLNAINRIGGPWPLSYSYGRALQASALEAWRGETANVEAAQAAFLHRARMNSAAVAGLWSLDAEQAGVGASASATG